MSVPAGHIQLQRAVDSIHVGSRHRHDLGDLDALVASIGRHGLWQPITITVDGHLICGARRLAAIRQLGWHSVNVWVRSGVSDRLSLLLAEQDDNQLHKPLTQLEAAGLYRELKTLLAEDAARRQEATRFQPADHAAADGAANLAAPSGDARAQAARMVTGRASYTTLERISRLEALAADDTQPESVRRTAAGELEQIRAGGKVHPAHLRVNAELSLAELDQLAADPAQPAGLREQARTRAADVRAAADQAKAAELERLAQAALARVKAAKKTTRTSKRRPLHPVDTPSEAEVEVVRFPVRAFLATWDDLDQWWTHYDPAEIAAALTDEQWARFEHTLAGTNHFADTARTTRHPAHPDRAEGIA